MKPSLCDILKLLLVAASCRSIAAGNSSPIEDDTGESLASVNEKNDSMLPSSMSAVEELSQLSEVVSRRMGTTEWHHGAEQMTFTFTEEPSDIEEMSQREDIESDEILTGDFSPSEKTDIIPYVIEPGESRFLQGYSHCGRHGIVRSITYMIQNDSPWPLRFKGAYFRNGRANYMRQIRRRSHSPYLCAYTSSDHSRHGMEGVLIYQWSYNQKNSIAIYMGNPLRGHNKHGIKLYNKQRKPKWYFKNIEKRKQNKKYTWTDGDIYLSSFIDQGQKHATATYVFKKSTQAFKTISYEVDLGFQGNALEDLTSGEQQIFEQSLLDFVRANIDDRDSTTTNIDTQRQISFTLEETRRDFGPSSERRLGSRGPGSFGIKVAINAQCRRCNQNRKRRDTVDAINNSNNRRRLTGGGGSKNSTCGTDVLRCLQQRLSDLFTSDFNFVLASDPGRSRGISNLRNVLTCTNNNLNVVTEGEPILTCSTFNNLQCEERLEPVIDASDDQCRSE